MNECETEPWDSVIIQPECVHPEHWLAVMHEGPWLDWDDAPAVCRWNQVHQSCELNTGHGEAHVWPGLKLYVHVLQVSA